VIVIGVIVEPASLINEFELVDLVLEGEHDLPVLVPLLLELLVLLLELIVRLRHQVTELLPLLYLRYS